MSFSPAEYKDHSLIGHVVKTVEVFNDTECFKQCVQSGSLCLSYNFEYGGAKQTYLCEINDVTKYDVAAWKFIERKKFIHYELIV